MGLWYIHISVLYWFSFTGTAKFDFWFYYFIFLTLECGFLYIVYFIFLFLVCNKPEPQAVTFHPIHLCSLPPAIFLTLPSSRSISLGFSAVGSLAACLPLHLWPSSFISSSSHIVLFPAVCHFFTCSFACRLPLTPPVSSPFLPNSPTRSLTFSFLYSISCSATWSFSLFLSSFSLDMAGTIIQSCSFSYQEWSCSQSVAEEVKNIIQFD